MTYTFYFVEIRYAAHGITMAGDRSRTIVYSSRQDRNQWNNEHRSLAAYSFTRDPSTVLSLLSPLLPCLRLLYEIRRWFDASKRILNKSRKSLKSTKA